MKFDVFRRYFGVYTKAIENAIENGIIDMRDFKFHEGMLLPVATELKKLKHLGTTKLTSPKVLKAGIKNALRNLSCLF